MPLPLSYNWRNLLVRRLSTSLTFTVVAAVVCVLSVLLSFTAGIQAALVASGSPQNLIVLKPGATAESTSVLTPEEIGRLTQTPGVARGVVDLHGSGTGTEQLLISQELCVQSSIPRKGRNGAMANVAVRGVDDVAFLVHTEVKLIEGRYAQQGLQEILVGKAARERYADLHMGGRIRLGRSSNRDYEVVGVFEAGGGALESEIWATRTLLMDSYNRPVASSALLRLESPERAAEAIGYVRGPTVGLDAKRETDYYNELAKQASQLAWVVRLLVGIMAVGAIFAVANTMHAAVDGRRREIAMLRTIGFSRGAVAVAFVIESLMICLTACLFGLAASMTLSGYRQDYLSDTTFTVLAFELRVTPANVLTALLMACIVGVGGAVVPAVRAARTGMIEGLRKA
jgi:ABC-type lipoprotein release transport system permease subunit